MSSHLLLVAALLQAGAVAYGLVLLSRREGATAAWLFLLGAMLSMLVWRLVVVTHIEPPAFFNPLIAIWGSSCMVGAMFFFGREVTLRRQAQQERDALLDSERKARADAEHASRLKDDFLATVSHELRSPLAAILGWCSVMRAARERREDLDRAIDVIERNARGQARLIEDLLDVTRMQAGNLYLDLRPLSLQQAVDAAIQDVRPLAAARSITIESARSGATPWVRGDPDRLRQVAANLLTNAVKFTPPGGHIRVNCTVRGAEVLLEVSDNGEGIDAAFLPHVFARFRQADGTTARRHGGLGLGLSIVAHLVQLHGGRVTAGSPGLKQGSTFTITLPLHEHVEDVPAPQAPGDAVVDATDLSGVRILMVDDEADVRDSTARMLESLGASVQTLASSTGVEDALTGWRPDVLLIDISMPGEDGYSLVQRIRRLPASAGGSIPAISLTAHARDADRSRALQAGFQRHLAKPVEMPTLAAAIRAELRYS